MNQPILIDIFFTKKFEKPPKVKIIKPSGAAVSEVKEDMFTLRTTINPRTKKLSVEYQVNFEQGNFEAFLNFCPACSGLSAKKATIFPAIFFQGQLSPGPPIEICLDCGCVFMAQQNIAELIRVKESPIIQPGGVV